MSLIHPTAVIDEAANLAADVKVGPYSVIGAGVSIGAGCEIKSHVVIEGDTTIGQNNTFFPFSSIGSPTQDKKFKDGDVARLEIGDNNVFREHVTINPGHTEPERLTKIGSNCLLMVASHVAHDCQLGDNVIMANNATLAGHVIVGSHVVIGGLAAVHQFVTIGDFAMIGGMSGVEHDVIPYGLVMGERAHLSGLNLVGMKRGGLSRDDIHAVRQTYKDLFEAEEGTLSERVANQNATTEAASNMLSFIQRDSSRGLCTPKATNKAS